MVEQDAAMPKQSIDVTFTGFSPINIHQLPSVNTTYISYCRYIYIAYLYMWVYIHMFYLYWLQWDPHRLRPWDPMNPQAPMNWRRNVMTKNDYFMNLRQANPRSRSICSDLIWCFLVPDFVSNAHIGPFQEDIETGMILRIIVLFLILVRL